MGLIKAGVGATGGTLADQWKEYFYCESMSKDVLATKGQKRTSKRSSNTKGNILYECFQYQRMLRMVVAMSIPCSTISYGLQNTESPYS